MKRSCVVCNKEFEVNKESKKKTCSPSCRTLYGRRNRKDFTSLQERKLEVKLCPICGDAIPRGDRSPSAWKKVVTCSMNCRNKHLSQVKEYLKPITKICSVCNKEFVGYEGTNHSKGKTDRDTCSRACASKIVGEKNSKKECSERAKEFKYCLTCGEKYYRTRWVNDEKWYKRKYCGLPCRRGDEESQKTQSKIMRKHIYSQAEKNYGILFPNYNEESCQLFKEVDETLGLSNSRYAMYGKGELHVEDIASWLDYCNPDLKVIIEWDDKSHFKPLKESDGVKYCHTKKSHLKKLLIKEYFPDYLFLSISFEKRNIEEIKEFLIKVLKRRQ